MRLEVKKEESLRETTRELAKLSGLVDELEQQYDFSDGYKDDPIASFDHYWEENVRKYNVDVRDVRSMNLNPNYKGKRDSSSIGVRYNEVCVVIDDVNYLIHMKKSDND